MKRPNKKDYQSLKELFNYKLKKYSEDQDRYIDYLEKAIPKRCGTNETWTYVLVDKKEL